MAANPPFSKAEIVVTKDEAGDIASAFELGTSPQAVHGRLLRARRKMAEDLRRNGFGRREP